MHHDQPVLLFNPSANVTSGVIPQLCQQVRLLPETYTVMQCSPCFSCWILLFQLSQNSKPRPLPTLRPIISKMPLPAMNSTKRIPKKPSCKRTACLIELSVQWSST